jgi:SAM-dependent methyltransferase
VNPVSALLRVPGVQRAARSSADWVDLQLSSLLKLLEATAPRARGRLLDVGCGNKPYEPIFRPYVSEYIGIEHEAMFAHTQSANRADKPDLYYDGKRLPFDDASFDTVLNVQVLEHTPEPQHLVREMGRVLRPGGLLIVSVPFSFRLHEEPHDYFRYTPHGLRVLMENANLDVEEFIPQGDLWSVLGHKLNSYLAFRVMRVDALAQQMGKLGMEEERKASPRYWTMPLVLPAMVAVSAAARALDRIAPDGTETLSYLVLARRKG